MKTTRQPYILPTLQSNFNYAINEILKRMNNQNIVETWKAIETLYTILPPKIFDSVTEEYELIVRRVNEANNGATIDYLSMVEANNQVNQILGELAIPFFRKMYEELYNGGYLEKKRRQAPMNLPSQFLEQQ